MRPSLSISEDFSSESYSSDSLSMSESISFEYSDIEEDSKKLEFSYTTEDVASFVCTIDQTLVHNWSGLKPYTVNFSTEDSDAAIEWVHNELRKGGHFEIKDRPTGKYVKACFTISFDELEEKYEEMKGVLVHDVLTALQLYGVDIHSVNYIIDTYKYKSPLASEKTMIYMLLPEYCMESTMFHSIKYTHEINIEYELLGFVRKGTPIIPNEICKLIKDFTEENKRFECGELLVRKFLYANRDKLINGETFTLQPDQYTMRFPTEAVESNPKIELWDATGEI
jgi:hypothetical protein